MRGNNNYKTRVQVLHPMENINSFQAFWSNSVGKKTKENERQKERARESEYCFTTSTYLKTSSLSEKMGSMIQCVSHLGWLRHLFFVLDCLFVYIMRMPRYLHLCNLASLSIAHGMCLHTRQNMQAYHTILSTIFKGFNLNAIIFLPCGTQALLCLSILTRHTV